MGESKWDRHSVVVGRYDVAFEMPRNQSPERPGESLPIQSTPLGDYDDREQFRQIVNPVWDFRSHAFKPVDGSLWFELAIVGLSQPVPVSRGQLDLYADRYHKDRVEHIRKKNEEGRRNGKSLFSKPREIPYIEVLHNGCLVLRSDWDDTTYMIIPLTERYFLLVRTSLDFASGPDSLVEMARSVKSRMVDSITVSGTNGSSPPSTCGEK